MAGNENQSSQTKTLTVLPNKRQEEIITRKTNSIHDIYRRLGEDLADLIEHPGCPPELRRCIDEFIVNIEEAAGNVNASIKDAAGARHVLPVCFGLLTTKE